jgi:hypothetical protein
MEANCHRLPGLQCSRAISQTPGYINKSGVATTYKVKDAGKTKLQLCKLPAEEKPSAGSKRQNDFA